MIERRKFLGAASLAAISLTSGRLWASQPATPRGWTSKVIQTVRHGTVNRRPIVTGVSLQSVGDLLAIVGDDHYVSVYDIVAEEYVDNLKEHTDWVRDTKFSPDGKMLFTCGNDHRLIGWNTADFSDTVFDNHRKHAIIKLAVSNDSKRVATVGFDNQLFIHDVLTGREQERLRCACSDNHAVAFSDDDKLIAAGGRCGKIRVWETASLKMIHEFPAHRRRVRSLEFSEAGNLISAGDDQIVRVNNLQDASASFTLPRHAAKLFTVKVISPSIIATAGSDNRIHIWNLDSLSEINLLSDHTGTVADLDFEQGMLVSGSFDATVRIWTPDANELAIKEPMSTFTKPAIVPSTSSSRSSQPGIWTRR